MPIIQNIDVWRGENVTLHFTMTPAEDITGRVMSMTVTKALDMTQKVFQVTGVIISGPNGRYDMILNGLLDIKPDLYKYDIFIVNPFIRIINIGDFIVHGDSKFPV